MCRVSKLVNNSRPATGQVLLAWYRTGGGKLGGMSPQTFQLCATWWSATYFILTCLFPNTFQPIRWFLVHVVPGSGNFYDVSFLLISVKYEKHQFVTYTHKLWYSIRLLRTVNDGAMPGFFCLAPKLPTISAQRMLRARNIYCVVAMVTILGMCAVIMEWFL